MIAAEFQDAILRFLVCMAVVHTGLDVLGWILGRGLRAVRRWVWGREDEGAAERLFNSLVKSRCVARKGGDALPPWSSWSSLADADKQIFRDGVRAVMS